MIWINTNGRPSNGAKALSEQPGFKRCITGKFIKPMDTVINWGSSQPLNIPNQWNILFNRPESVAMATNKLDFFSYLFGPESNNPYNGVFVRTVEWRDKKAEAQKWSDEGHIVVARTKLTGHSGDGIIIVEKGGNLPDAPLYTKYVFKEKEYRVHVVCGKVVDTQRKIKDPNREVKDWKVRSHENGFIFVRNSVDHDLNRDNLAIAAIKALGLDFGAVDIIQDKKGVYYVLEVNTAPGLEGQTIQNYAGAFRGGEVG